MKQTCYTYQILRFLFTPLFRLLYHPHVMGSDNIPATGAVILAGNHMHALDPILIDTSTKRIVRTLAKKDLHDGPFGFVFRAVHTIPVDLHSKHNPAACRCPRLAAGGCGECISGGKAQLHRAAAFAI